MEKNTGRKKKSGKRVGAKIRAEITPYAEAMLAEAQRIFQVGSWNWDLATDKIQFSEEMFRLVGMLPGEMEITREVFAKFLHPGEAEQILWKFQHSASYPFPRFEHKIVMPNGEIRTVQTRIKAYQDEHGKPLRLLGSTQDITEQKRMAVALQESEWRNRIVSELTTDYIFVVDVDPGRHPRLRWVSESMSRLTGRSIAEVQTLDFWREIIHPDDIARFFGFIDHILSAVEVSELECRAFLKHDEERWIHIFARPQTDEGNNVTTVVGAVRDITERKRAEEALRVAESDYRTIFEGAPVGIFRATVEGHFVKVNQAMTKMYGYGSAEEMIAEVQSISRQIYTEPRLRQEFVRLLAEYGEVFDFESLDRRRNGRLFWTSKSARIVKNEHGEAMYYEGFVIDITARKQSEVALQKVNEQLRIQLAENRKLQTTLHEQAIHDQLTGLYNRHYMQEAIKRQHARAIREGHPISIVLLDLDNLKEINRRYGHFTGGDIALRILGKHLKTLSRTEDIVCRQGGDEFLIALHNTNVEVAFKRTEQLRMSLTKTKIDGNGIKFNISFSAGIAGFPDNGKYIEEVIRSADKALYHAKEQGRNCVVIYSE